MALSMLRAGLQNGRMVVPTIRLTPASLMVEKRRGLISKKFFQKDPDMPKPWPYESIKFTSWDGLFENTEDRFHQNSRVIVVDGNVGVGKSTFAKKIAEEFDMLHFPEATLDFLFIDDEGNDVREVDHLVPPSTRAFDITRFYAEPKNPLVAEFQYNMLAIRFEQYLDALAHILNTGQGVVLERSVFSDFVFMETMLKFGYVNNYDMSVYKQMKKNCILSDIFKPHLIIYLDAPVKVLQKRIKDRALPYEINSSVLTEEYLTSIDNQYKNVYLPSMKTECEIVCLDWSEFGDISDVVEDLERLPIDAIMNDIHDEKFFNWKQLKPREWDHWRMYFTNEKLPLVYSVVNVAKSNSSEFILPTEDIIEYNRVFAEYFDKKAAKKLEKDTSYWFDVYSSYRDEIKYFFRTR